MYAVHCKTQKAVERWEILLTQDFCLSRGLGDVYKRQMIMSIKQKEVKFKPRIKLNHNKI